MSLRYIFEIHEIPYLVVEENRLLDFRSKSSNDISELNIPTFFSIVLNCNVLPLWGNA